MLFLLLLIYSHSSEENERPNLKFPRTLKRFHDDPLPEPLPSPFGNKVYLKNKLLDNLNHFFPNPGETLEILGSRDVAPSPSLPDPNSILESMEMPAISTRESPPTQIQNSRPNSLEHNPFPTLIPTDSPSLVTDSSTPSTQPSPLSDSKRRSEGPIVSIKVLDSIRDWRKRLYKAFKTKKPRTVPHAIETTIPLDAKTSGNEVVDLKDLTQMVVDKNRQVLLSRKEPNWHAKAANRPTFGRDGNGKVIRLFGTQASGYKAEPLNDSPSDHFSTNELIPISSYRKAYRTPGGRNVVYIPAPSPTATLLPPPVDQRETQLSAYQVTATAASPTLPPLFTFTPPQNTLAPLFFTTSAPYSPGSNFAGASFNLPAQRPLELPTTTPNYVEDNDLEEYSDDNVQSQQQVGVMNRCGGELICSNGQTISEEKCNSMRLRAIIQSNIVPNDAEASKRAVQSVAESETGQFFDAVCGTGFFSYIAHTDEFCLSSAGGVNCYVFSPVCSEPSPTIFAKLRKSKRRVFLNRN